MVLTTCFAMPTTCFGMPTNEIKGSMQYSLLPPSKADPENKIHV